VVAVANLLFIKVLRAKGISSKDLYPRPDSLDFAPNFLNLTKSRKAFEYRLWNKFQMSYLTGEHMAYA